MEPMFRLMRRWLAAQAATHCEEGAGWCTALPAAAAAAVRHRGVPSANAATPATDGSSHTHANAQARVPRGQGRGGRPSLQSLPAWAIFVAWVSRVYAMRRGALRCRGEYIIPVQW